MKKNITYLLLPLLCIASLCSCGGSETLSSLASQTTSNSENTSTGETTSNFLTDFSGDSLGGGGVVESVPEASTSNDTVNEKITAIHAGIIDADGDYSAVDENDSAVDVSSCNASITLSTDGATISDATYATYENNIVTIIKAGIIEITGENSNVQIFSELASNITLVLNNASLTCKFGAAILFTGKKSKKIVLVPNTVNNITTTADYVSDDPDAAIKTKKNLVIVGSGTLNVTSNHANGNAIKAGKALKILGDATVNVLTCMNNALKGDDCVILNNATVTTTKNVLGKAIYAEVDETDTTDTIGFIYALNSTLTLNCASGSDCLKGDQFIYMVNTSAVITTGDGFTSSGETETSDQCIKSDGSLLLEGSKIKLSAKDDGINCGDSVILQSAIDTDNETILSEVIVSANEDGIHADDLFFSDDGSIVSVNNSYEGIEASKIFIDGGKVSVNASDDGLNASDGSDSQAYNSSLYILISSGSLYVNANGDGIDSNGSVSITGGVITVDGPTNGGNAALDSNGGILISGGTLIACGSLGMVEAPGSNSTQYSISCGLPAAVNANTSFNIKDSSGNEIITHAPNKAYQSIVLSTGLFEKGNSYTITAGSYSYDFTISSAVTTIGQVQGGPGGGGPGGH